MTMTMNNGRKERKWSGRTMRILFQSVQFIGF